MIKKILPLALWLIATVTVSGQNAVMVNRSNSIITYPLNFWTANALAGRSGLGFNTNLNAFWVATNAAAARTAIGALTTNSSGSALTNITAANITGTVALASNVTGTIAISNGGSGAVTAGGARTNLGLGTTNQVGFAYVEAPYFFVADGTNGIVFETENVTAITRTNIGIGAGSITEVGFGNVKMGGSINFIEPVDQATVLGLPTDTDPVYLNPIHWDDGGVRTALGLGISNNVIFKDVQATSFLVGDETNSQIAFEGNSAAITRTNLGLGWTALTNTNATNFRTALGLGSAATNSALAFQPSSSTLTNLAASNGSALTNLNASGITGTIAISNGGSGATTAGGARTNFGLGAGNNVTFDSLILGGTTNTLGVYDFYAPAAKFDGIQINGYDFIVDESGNLTLFADLYFGTASNATITRTNLGLGWSALTNSNTATGLVGYNTNNGNVVMPSNLTFSNNVNFGQSMFATTNGVSAGGTLFAGSGSTITFYDAEDRSRWRTNLGLPWSALTNTNAAGFNASIYGSGTNPVLYNNGGQVVSPTNFWQAAPINTVVQYQTNVTGTSTNAATNARNLYLYSLAPTVSGVTNTVTLPTNSATFLGDVATVIHEGPTNSFTAIRQIGSATNIISLNQFQEAVQFIYNGDGWKLADNISYTEPIYFSGTNAAFNRAASVTNLFTPNTPLVVNTNGQVVYSGTNDLRLPATVRFGTNSAGISSGGQFLSLLDNLGGISMMLGTNAITVYSKISFGGLDAASNAATTRTNLGIPLAALTNTNNADFQAAIFSTNSVPTNTANVNAVNFNTAIHWMEVNVVTNGVTNNFRIPLFK